MRYRIITNGLSFRVQYRRFLGWHTVTDEFADTGYLQFPYKFRAESWIERQYDAEFAEQRKRGKIKWRVV